MHKRICDLALGAVMGLSAACAMAQQKPGPLPWSVATGDYVLIGVQWDEATVRQALPAGIKAAADLSGGVALYKTTSGFGAGVYDGAYAFVNVEGFDSADGSKGRWIMQGAYGPNEALSAAIREAYGWPVRNGSVDYEETVTGKRAALTVGGTRMIEMNVNISAMPCPAVAGVAHYVGKAKSAGKFTLNQIPFTGQWCGAEPVTLNVVAPASDAFSRFVPAKVLWAGQFKSGAVAFSVPVVR